MTALMRQTIDTMERVGGNAGPHFTAEKKRQLLDQLDRTIEAAKRLPGAEVIEDRR